MITQQTQLRQAQLRVVLAGVNRDEYLRILSEYWNSEQWEAFNTTIEELRQLAWAMMELYLHQYGPDMEWKEIFGKDKLKPVRSYPEKILVDGDLQDDWDSFRREFHSSVERWLNGLVASTTNQKTPRLGKKSRPDDEITPDEMARIAKMFE